MTLAQAKKLYRDCPCQHCIISGVQHIRCDAYQRYSQARQIVNEDKSEIKRANWHEPRKKGATTMSIGGGKTAKR